MKNPALLLSDLRASVSRLESCLTTASQKRCLGNEDRSVQNAYRRYLKSKLSPACLDLRFAIRQIEYAIQLELSSKDEKNP